MPLLNTHARTAGPTKNELFQPMGRAPVHFGVFVGFVKRVDDVQRNGRLMVWIPEFGSAPDNENGWIGVNYCSPFAGATNVNSTSQSNLQQFDGTQTSYGMWMVPPDINNQVIVMFLNGDPSKGIWIGSLFQQYMNNMVPGIPADVKNWQYPGKEVPVAEYNKWDQTVTYPDRAFKPYEKTKFKGVGNQGLITDNHRGITTSGARREAPSNVFGILTPGPAIDSNASPKNIRRKGGSSFIMDDGVGSEYVQLTTKSGAQVRLDETNGFVYLINRDGTAWVQMDQKGNIDIFGATNISMRAQKDINLRADRNINIEAGQNIFMKAAKDTINSTTSFTYDVNNIPKSSTIPYYKYVGEGSGVGGNIVMQALNDWHSTITNTSYTTVINSDMNISVGNNLNLTTVNGSQNYNSKQSIAMTSQASFDLSTTGNIRVSSQGMISVVGLNDIVLCTSANLNLKSGVDIQIASGSNTLLTASNFGVTSPTLFSDTVGITGTLTAAGTANLLAEYASVAGSLGSTSPFSSSLPTESNPTNAEGALTAAKSLNAEVKPYNNKINILATWQSANTYPDWKINTPYKAGQVVTNSNIRYIAKKDIIASLSFNTTLWDTFSPEDKFKRNSESLQTVTSRLPTYEPCPEHETFKFSSTAGYTPTTTAGAKTYEGSGGAGNEATSAPAPNTTPGANNKEILPDPAGESVVSKDFNMAAYECQLKIHEGVVYKVYLDSVGLPTAGIGHLLRANEQQPIGTPVSPSQASAWFQSDALISISGAQQLLGIDTWDKLSDIRKRASADLCYNMGKSRLAKFKGFIAGMKAGDFNLAGASLKDSKWFTQVGKRGPNIITMIVQNIDPNGCDLRFKQG